MSTLDEIVREYDCFDEESAVKQACAAAELAGMVAKTAHDEIYIRTLKSSNEELRAALDEARRAIAEALCEIATPVAPGYRTLATYINAHPEHPK